MPRMGPFDEQAVDYDAEAAEQARIASEVGNRPDDVPQPAVAGSTEDAGAGETVEEGSTEVVEGELYDADDTVRVVLDESATGEYFNPETRQIEEAPLNELSVAGVVVKPGEPVEVSRSVAAAFESYEAVEVQELQEVAE